MSDDFRIDPEAHFSAWVDKYLSHDMGAMGAFDLKPWQRRVLDRMQSGEPFNLAPPKLRPKSMLHRHPVGQACAPLLRHARRARLDHAAS